ncbi:major facilitator transporter [Chryseobacterium piperi]|uniref:Major facilitator transporter n=1 Tax=Chryseobacterium piperi TaxID=558152 RepID=A0A086BN41_9FLAO|nr:MFS transporter [Chryseobacterium piperi]ASW75148.1 MFS transporter [Chryseobacterium piperi]KFF30355.1 major facilitator transporter [Chryseobacterium piperi]
MGKNNSGTRSIPLIFWISTLYFAMGVPFVTINAVSGIMYKDMGVSDSKIAFWTALILFSWTIKPLWSPFLEIYKTKKFFVVATQFAIGILFALIAFSLPLPGFFKYSIALFAVVAFCGATHDIAADGTYINFLTNKEQAKYIGWQGAFYNLAKIISSGVLVYFAGVLEKTQGITKAWMIIMGVYALLFFILGVYHYSVLPKENNREKQKNAKTTGNIRKELVEVITSFFTKKKILWSVLFIILYRFAEGFAIKIAPLFFKASRTSGGLGLSTSDIGLIYGTYGSAAFILGSVLAGYFISARGLKRSLIWLCCAFNIPFVVYALLAHYQPDTLLPVSIAVVVEYFGYGFGFVGLMLYMMQQIAPGKHKTAHYAFATGIMNLGVMIPGMFSGMISDWIGYKMFFIWVLIATIPAFVVTLIAPFPHTEKQEEH